MQIGSRRLIRRYVVVFIPNTVGREELLKRPTTESTRMGIYVDLHGMLPRVLKPQRVALDTLQALIVGTPCAPPGIVLVWSG